MTTFLNILVWLLPTSFIMVLGWTLFRINRDKKFNDDCMTDEHYNEEIPWGDVWP